MKNINIKLLISLLILLSVGCNGTPKQTYANQASDANFGRGLNTIEHDSCEYVVYFGYRKGGLAHKGNCKFCKQRNK